MWIPDFFVNLLSVVAEEMVIKKITHAQNVQQEKFTKSLQRKLH